MPVSGPKFHKEAVALEPEFAQDEKILSQLRWRLSKRRQGLADHRRRKQSKEFEVGLRLLAPCLCI